MTSDFDYKKYSLEKLQEWVHDALSTGEASPHEIYSAIREAVREDYYYYKDHCSRAYGLLELLSGHRPVKDENAAKWDEWEATHYPEEYKVEDIMPPWGHSDMEALRYTEEELNAMCDKAASDQEKDKCREYNLREAEYYNKRAEMDIQNSKVKKWVLPVEEVQDAETGKDEYYVAFPDDLLEAADLKEGDQVEWVDQGDGSYLLKKVEKKAPTYDEMIAAGYIMTADGFWMKETIKMDEC